ncbi:MAG: CGNR zinc finger domain-containing protein [Roseiflexaceae bacterium]
MMEPGGRRPAPGPLGLVQAFINTVDIEEQREELITPERLRAWLAAHGLMDGADPMSEADLRRAIAFREALRALLLANNDGIIDAGAVETLNRIAGHAGLLVCFGPDGQARLEPIVVGVNGALGRLLAIVYAAMVEGSWTRLKACRNDSCRWAFYDASKNQGGAWCAMASCGSRSKARAYRRRQAEQAVKIVN